MVRRDQLADRARSPGTRFIGEQLGSSEPPRSPAGVLGVNGVAAARGLVGVHPLARSRRRAVYSSSFNVSAAAPAQLGRAVLPSLTYFNEVDKGGHFAAWEEPELFSAELRAAFNSVR
jgi:hypothetical protein